MCVADWHMAQRMKITKADLLTPALTVSVADNASLELMGAQFLKLTAQSGQTSEQLVYFAKGVGEFYLSKAALMDLKLSAATFQWLAILHKAAAAVLSMRSRTGSRPVLHQSNSRLHKVLVVRFSLQVRPHPTAFLFVLPPASHWVQPHWG